ncbi:MAG: hypothetical protein IT521_05035 [Burkholderiales bacterium]|nr:hypothetical protein [Burkholderiales bacterium]
MSFNRTIALVSALGLALSVTACGDGKSTASNATPASQPTASAPMPPPASSPPPTPVPPPTSGATDPATTAQDSAATDPKGTMTKEEESKQMPQAGQANNHSSPALDSTAKK